MRLNVYIARATGLSRRAADSAVREGRVTVDGSRTDFPGEDVAEDSDVRFDGKPVNPPEEDTWVILNKPAGYITTRDDPAGRTTVMELLPKRLRRLFPVGRLDAETTGLLLFTDDGKAANRLLHPKFGVPRRYVVELSGSLSEDDVTLARRGVILDGRRAVPTEFEKIDSRKNGECWMVEFREGRYHEVRRFFAALGQEVIKLRRVSFCGVTTGDLGEGEWRLLTKDEVDRFMERLEGYTSDENC